MSKYKIRKTIASVLVSVSTVAALGGGSLLVPMVAFAQTDQAALIAQLQAQILALQAQLNALLGGGSVAVSGSCSFTRDLTVGSRGDDVTCLQNYLAGTGHFTYAGGATGYFGSVTKAAVAAWQAANGVSPAAGYFGSISRAKHSSLAVVAPPPPPPPAPVETTPPPTTTPPATGGGLTVAAPAAQVANSLAPGNATAQAVRVPFTKFTLTAGASDATVNGVTVERVGFGADANFSGIVLLDENGVQMDIAKTLGSDHRATIGGTFKVPAGTTKTYTVAGNMASNGARAGQVVAISVVAVNTTETVSGTLPITGAAHTINATLTIGGVTMAKGSVDPGSSISKPVGTTGYTFSAVRVTAGSAEKVYLKSIRWNQTGSAGSGDLGNLKSYVDGTAYDAVVTSDGKYYVTTFPENGGKGLLIDKGFSKEISIKGDVAGGSGRTIIFSIAKRVDIDLVGETYGFGIQAPQTSDCSSDTTSVSCFRSVEDPWFRGSTVTVQSGTITVSSSNLVPAGNIAVNAPNVNLAGFQVEVKGEPVSVGAMIFNLLLSNGSAGVAAGGNATEVTNVSLVKEDGTILAGPVDGADVLTGIDGTVTFSSSVTFPVGTTKVKLTGKIGTNFATNNTLQASTTPSTKWTTVTGQVTGNSITPSPTTAISGLTQTVKAAALKVSVSSQPIAQTVIANASKFVFANYMLDTGASGEDIRVTSLPLELNVSSGTATDISNCQLYDGATSVTSSNIVAPTAAASNTLFTFDGNGLVLSKGVQKTLAMKCDIKSGSTGSYKWGLDGERDGTNFTAATGLVSGQTINDGSAFTDSEGQLMTAAAGGSLTVTIDSGSSGSLAYRLVSPGQTVELIKIKYSATNEDIDVKRVGLVLSSAASNTPIDLVGQQVTLWDGTTQVGTATFDASTDRATSTLTTPVRVTKGGSKIITVKGTIATIGSSGPLTRSGDLLVVNYDGANVGINGNYGLGVESGSTISGSTGVTASNGVRIMKGYPEFANEALSSSERLLVSGDARTLYKFKVTAKNGEVALYKMSFTVSSSTLAATTSKFGLYAFTNLSYSTPDSNFDNTNNPGGLINSGNCYGNTNTYSIGGAVKTLEIYPTTSGCNSGTSTLSIPDGESRWFKLVGSVASLAAAATTETIQVQLDGDAAYAVNSANLLDKAINSDGDTNDDFIWSPRSTSTSASIEDLDFTNGYGIVGLPSTNMTIETLKNN